MKSQKELKYVKRATELVPLLRQHSAEGERLGSLTPEVERALKEAGLLTLLRPRCYGGAEIGIRTYIHTLIELSRGCGSAGWVASQLNNMLFMTALTPRPLRDELFSSMDTYVAGVLVGQTTARRTEGGYIIDGRWPFCSGCRQANWIFAGALLDAPQGGMAPAFFVAPASEFTILDDWQVSGFCATGSNTVVAKELLVPDSRIAWALPIVQREPTSEDLEAPLYKVPLLPFIVLTAAAVGVGMAQAILAEFRVQLPGRAIAFTTYEKRSEAAVTHIQLGETAAKIEAARMLLDACGEELEAQTLLAAPMPVEQRLRIRTLAMYVTQLAQEASNLLLGASGAHALALSNPLQRIARDINALCAHPAYAAQVNYEAYGRVLTGLAPTMQLI